MPNTHSISVSQMRALKRQRVVVVCDDEDSYSTHTEVRPLPPGPHAPAKAEARVLRRLCAQTGLSADQVRERRAYRIELAQAAQARGSKSPQQRYLLRFLKQLQREVKLPHWHPQLKVAFIEAWDRRPQWAWRSPVAGLTGPQAFALAMQHRSA